MALQILGTGPDPEEIAGKLRGLIEAALPDAAVEISAESAGHYRIRVVSRAFEGLGRVRQQQLVYQAITPLMSGPHAPVHAVDRLESVVPPDES